VNGIFGEKWGRLVIFDILQAAAVRVQAYPRIGWNGLEAAKAEFLQKGAKETEGRIEYTMRVKIGERLWTVCPSLTDGSLPDRCLVLFFISLLPSSGLL
jgi:hypothetical protein